MHIKVSTDSRTAEIIINNDEVHQEANGVDHNRCEPVLSACNASEQNTNQPWCEAFIQIKLFLILADWFESWKKAGTWDENQIKVMLQFGRFLIRKIKHGYQRKNRKRQQQVIQCVGHGMKSSKCISANDSYDGNV